MGVRDSEVGRFQKFFFELFRPRVNFGRKQKNGLKNFVPQGHPTIGPMVTPALHATAVATTLFSLYQEHPLRILIVGKQWK